MATEDKFKADGVKGEVKEHEEGAARDMSDRAVYSAPQTMSTLKGAAESSASGDGDTSMKRAVAVSGGAGGPPRTMRPPSSSTSTLYLSSTISVPNSDEIILGVSTVLHFQIRQEHSVKMKCPTHLKETSRLFDFKIYSTKPDEKVSSVPSVDTIYAFLRRAFAIAQFSPECNILALVYINRVTTFTKMPITGKTWQLLLLCSLLLAQKVWDDRALTNADFPTVWGHAFPKEKDSRIDLKTINLLERKLLELIQYNVTVSSSLYTKYYFELRTLAEENDMKFRLQPLTTEQAKMLEARSASKRDLFKSDTEFKGMRLSLTLGDITATPKGRAVLS